MQRNTGDTQAITVEYGFLDSKKDDVSQLKNNWQNYAEAAVQGVLNYIGYNENIIDNSVYIVKAGDTLYSIARKYNTTVNDIKRLNNLSSDMLSIGQRIKIPMENNSNSIDNNYYVVQAGDTLYNIANKNNMTVNELKRINNLINDDLYIGQQLILSNRFMEPVFAEEMDKDYYIVRVGDTLYSIAHKYGTTVDELMEYNNLDSNMLSIGQQLYIPPRYHIVKVGDTLYSIAHKYGTTVDDIMKKNNLGSNMLSIGQQLKI